MSTSFSYRDFVHRYVTAMEGTDVKNPKLAAANEKNLAYYRSWLTGSSVGEPPSVKGAIKILKKTGNKDVLPPAISQNTSLHPSYFGLITKLQNQSTIPPPSPSAETKVDDPVQVELPSRGYSGDPRENPSTSGASGASTGGDSGSGRVNEGSTLSPPTETKVDEEETKEGPPRGSDLAQPTFDVRPVEADPTVQEDFAKKAANSIAPFAKTGVPEEAVPTEEQVVDNLAYKYFAQSRKEFADEPVNIDNPMLQKHFQEEDIRYHTDQFYQEGGDPIWKIRSRHDNLISNYQKKGPPIRYAPAPDMRAVKISGLLSTVASDPDWQPDLKAFAKWPSVGTYREAQQSGYDRMRTAQGSVVGGKRVYINHAPEGIQRFSQLYSNPAVTVGH